MDNIDKILAYLSSNKDTLNLIIGSLTTGLGAIIGFASNWATLGKKLRHDAKQRNLDRNLSQFDLVFTDFCKNLSYAIGRYRAHKEDPRRYDKVYVMERMNEVRQSRTRLLSVCGSHIKELLTSKETDWLRDIDSFYDTALEIEDKLPSIASDDRQTIMKRFC